MLLVNFYLTALVDNISVYIMFSLKESDWKREREKGGKQLPAPTANEVGPCPIATVFAPDDFIISINKTVKLDLIYGCAFVSSRDGRPEKINIVVC